jgi:hypothetical protein
MYNLNKLKFSLSTAGISILFAVYSFTIINFVWIDGLSSFASDSANYMAMALYMSPWQEPTAAIKAIWPYQFYPPFFPIVLALTGTAHSLVAAHILTTAFLLASLPLIYFFSRQCFATHWQAISITVIFSLSPSTWLNTLGILSENLYLFLSFIVLLMFNRIRTLDYRLISLFGILLAALILTRSIGIAMFIAYLIVGFILWQKKKLQTGKYFLPIVIVIAIKLLAKLLGKSILPVPYIIQLKLLDFTIQPEMLVDTWFASWQYYWVDDLIIPHFFVLFLGVLACTGLIIRLRLLKIDAFYLLVYLGILLVWPHPGQALRFIYPVHALLIIYAFYSVHIVLNKLATITKDRVILILLLISFATIGPTLSFSWNRYHLGKEYGYHQIYEFYKLHDIKHARYIASIETTMFDDMKLIESMTKTEDTVFHFTPVYVALLANRQSITLEFNYPGEEMIIANNNSDANYAYISKLHPRRTGKDFHGDAELIMSFTGQTDLLWQHYSNENNKPVSIFLKLIK